MRKQFITYKSYPQEPCNAPTVCFRKRFIINNVKNAKIKVCALGIGYFYINGKLISEDLFTAPVADYRKTLWYNEYDVSELLQEGENELFAEVGNGFYNENFVSGWKHHLAKWRDNPKLCVALYVNDELFLQTDSSWESALSHTTVYNQIRSGEYYDSRYEDVNKFDWKVAELDDNPPQGVLRRCDCQPIREFDRLTPIRIIKSENGWIFDFGRTISGYAEIDVCGESGQEITIKFAEEIRGNELDLLHQDIYLKAPFQTDKVILNGKRVVWKPKYTYHGFRYAEVIGLKNSPNEKLLTAIFVHQAMDKIGHFECSDEILNKIYKAGIASVYSNSFYELTDCPTREKLGWLNDATASLEQIIFNFDAKDFLYKWFVDICDAMTNEGALPGIVPSPDWGYGYGPLCSSIIFLLPYFAFKYYGDKEFLFNALPYMRRYYAFQKENIGKSSLADWSGGFATNTPVVFVDVVYMYIFTRIFKLLDEMQGLPVNKEIDADYKRWKEYLESRISYGKCSILEQSVIAALIILDIGDTEELGKQLVQIIEYWDGHMHVGMFGVQFLYRALTKIGRADLAYSMITNPTAPSFLKNILKRNV